MPKSTIFIHKSLSRLMMLSLVLLFLAACGGQPQQGVQLQPVGGPAHTSLYHTATPTPDTPVALGLSGRLLYLKGEHLEILDLASGETQAFNDMKSRSPVILSPDAARGVYIAFPDLGLVDLVSEEVRTVRSAASNPIGYGISPDGQWAIVLNGSFTRRLQVINFDNLSLFTVAGKSETFFNWVWTTDSHLIWWEANDDPQWMLFDTATSESTPVDLDAVTIEIPAPAQLSPDGQSVAQVPVFLGTAHGQAAPDTCFDSYVELYDTGTGASMLTQAGHSLWTESGLIASSPQWLTNDLLLFVKVGSGACGEVQGTPDRQVMVLDVTASDPQPRVLAGPLGNADDTNDRPQQGRQYGHLYSPSPEGRFVAWISGGFESGTSAISVTEVATGATQTVLSVEAADAHDAADYLENHLIRQVIWLR